MKKHSNGLRIKSALLVGMGEQDDEIKETIQDLKSAGCDTVIVGQYLRPTLKHMAPHRYVPPSVFKEYKRFGEMIGVKVFAKPLARSSYYLANSLNEL
jgi:lipoic acid synthetase